MAACFEDSRLPDREILDIHFRFIKRSIDDNDKRLPAEKKHFALYVTVIISCIVSGFFIVFLKTEIAAIISVCIFSFFIPFMFMMIKWHVEQMAWLSQAHDRVKKSVGIVESYLQGKRPAIGGNPETTAIDDDVKDGLQKIEIRSVVEQRLKEGKDFLERFM